MKPLAGRTVALAESRQLDLLARLVEEAGGRVVRCPLVAVEDAIDRGAVLDWIKELVERPFDEVIFYTGEGVRRLADVAVDAGIEADFIAALQKVHKVSRGPKPARALRELALEADLIVQPATTDGLLATLSAEPLHGRIVGVQLFGEDPAAKLVGFLRGRGAVVHPVAPYRYASAADDARVVELIDQLGSGAIDLIAFTSTSQVLRLSDVAARYERKEALLAALKKIAVAAVGPVVAESLRERGIRVDAAPDRSFTLKPLVRVIAAALARA